ncbi:MAG: AmmeMemoRadiSam system radical SAM enzyme [Candidatus Omnitrophica bacterium]|nr:AmmeMemoRadiSam system radical SAM enzyme [Candidatus Omnitrophota bacterium]
MKRRPIPAVFSALIVVTLSFCFSAVVLAAKPAPRIASYWERVRDNVVQCVLCPRKCIIDVGQRGVCTARINKDGMLYTLGYGNPIAVHVDPIEKKPFFNVLPGTNAFSIAVAGCNMRCLFCQNWQISQSKPDEVTAYDMPPEEVVKQAQASNCPFIVYTYTEPIVFYEYMLDISKLARTKGLKNGMHTCGYVNPEPLKELLKYMDAVNVDLKGFNEAFYKKMGMMAELQPVLETIKTVRQEGVWLEITNLLIPGQNDDPEEIRRMCVWIKENTGSETPLHFSKFTPSFQLQNLPPTPLKKLEEAARIAKDAGLKYVYVGNVPGHPLEDTYCPNCGKKVMDRLGYEVLQNNIKNGKCKFCGYKIAGIWSAE